MIEVRRPSDGELCGHVRSNNGIWQSLTVFGGLLGTHPSEVSAEEHVRELGLASLAERWWFRRDSTDEWQIVCIQEANPHSVRLALDYYSMPGVPTVTVTQRELQSGATLTLQPDA